jgi:hypothetical protein
MWLGEDGFYESFVDSFRLQYETMVRTQAIRMEKIHGEFQDAKLGCDKLY